VRKEVGADSAQGLLEAAYQELGYVHGTLLDATDSPQGLTADNWIDKGEWLSLAKKVGAEKVFFIDNNPVIVFARSAPNGHRLRFQEIWNMARPPLLFLASPGELAVYDLTQGPAQSAESWDQDITERQLDRATTIKEVAEKLSRYRREQIESGKVFGDITFGDNQRADKALIADLRLVRTELTKHKQLKPRHVHSLIGRSIFIRYLEDRKILVREYFERVARGNKHWQKLLDTPLPSGFADSDLAGRSYLRVLQDKSFTYALFRQLAIDFNGDMFPEDPAEKKAVTESHLRLLGAFLCGNTDPSAPKLFFFAYRFDIIPIELISSIYEEFYHTENDSSADGGSHYTPPCLAEFVLSQVLTDERLARRPVILDPACGSGVFLVEAFRRIVRYKSQKQNSRLNWNQLRNILRDQIAGIEINEEALRVTAFSLYLAFMHYLEPKDILAHIARGRRLPNLLSQPPCPDSEHFNILLHDNSFNIELHTISGEWRLGQNSVDIVIGNPPWGKYKSIGHQGKKVKSWCDSQGKTVGNTELSQAFIHLSVHLLNEGGVAGLLVPTAGTILNRARKSRAFRWQWLDSVSLREVVSFDHARDVYFHDAIAPFSCVVFEKRGPNTHVGHVSYWSVKKTKMATQLQSVLLTKADLKSVAQRKLMENDLLWKVYWWGNHRDEALINGLRLESPLSAASDEEGSFVVNSGRGIMVGDKTKPAGFLKKFKGILVTKRFRRYGEITDADLEAVPPRVERRREKELFEGERILFKQSPSSSFTGNGCIAARIETGDLCFRHSIYSLKMRHAGGWQPKVLLGILWSSLARYYFFMTASSWGSWHDKIGLDELLRLPVRMPTEIGIRDRIVGIVDALRSTEVEDNLFTAGRSVSEVRKLEAELDTAVFDLYGLSQDERDQITDMCIYGLDLFYKHSASDAVKRIDPRVFPTTQGTLVDVPVGQNARDGIDRYLSAFLEIWNRELEPDGEFRWDVIRPRYNIPMLAVVFATQERGERVPQGDRSGVDRWQETLSGLDKSLTTPLGSRRIYVDGLVRAVSDTDIVIIKRDERRLWTATTAREDAEATLLQAIHLQKAKGGA